MVISYIYFIYLYFPKPNFENAIDSKDMETAYDDLITLSGYGYITHWRFPESLKKCPLTTCAAKFSTRKATIAHYKTSHSKQAILCTICNKPIVSTTKQAFIFHYKRIHPQQSLPIDFIEHIRSKQTVRVE